MGIMQMALEALNFDATRLSPPKNRIGESRRLHGQNDSCADGGESQAELEFISIDAIATSDRVASTAPRYANASDSGRNAT